MWTSAYSHNTGWIEEVIPKFFVKLLTILFHYFIIILSMTSLPDKTQYFKLYFYVMFIATYVFWIHLISRKLIFIIFLWVKTFKQMEFEKLKYGFKKRKGKLQDKKKCILNPTDFLPPYTICAVWLLGLLHWSFWEQSWRQIPAVFPFTIHSEVHQLHMDPANCCVKSEPFPRIDMVMKSWYCSQKRPP